MGGSATRTDCPRPRPQVAWPNEYDAIQSMHLFKWLVGSVIFLVLVSVAAVFVYCTIPSGNTKRSHFDTIIVLGSPTNQNGTASPVGRARVLEGVREYQRGVAPTLIMTGGRAHNQYVEEEAMADFAVAQGVPSGSIVREGQAHDTIQNAYYSVQLMQARGWTSAEVVSSPSHLARASLIFERFPIEFRTHAAPDAPEMGRLYPMAAYVREIEYTDTLRLFGFKPNRFLPTRH